MADDHTRLDHRLTGAVDRLTPPPDTDAVLLAVERRRRAQRSSRRRRDVAARGAVLAASVAACVVGFVTLRTDDLDRVESVDGTAVAAGPATTTAESAESAGEGDAGAMSSSSVGTILDGQVGESVEVPGRGEHITGIGSDPDGFWIARGDPLQATDPGVTTISHVDATGNLRATAEIHGVPIVSVVAGGRLWLVAEDRVTSATDRTRFRLKQIDASSGQVLTSTPLPSEVPLGVRVRDDEVRIVEPAGELVVDPDTLAIRTEENGAEDRDGAAGPSAIQVVTSGGSTWVLSTEPTMVTTRAGAGRTTSAAAAAPGVDRLVVADSWADGAVAAVRHTTRPDRLDLIQLTPPVGGGSDLARVRIRLAGLPAGTSLVAVTEDMAWLLVGDRLVPTRPD